MKLKLKKLGLMATGHRFDTYRAYLAPKKEEDMLRERSNVSGASLLVKSANKLGFFGRLITSLPLIAAAVVFYAIVIL